MSASGDERGERLRAQLASDTAGWAEITRWVARQWWIYLIASGALALSALADLRDPEADVRTDAIIALVISGLLMLAGIFGFTRWMRRRRAR